MQGVRKRSVPLKVCCLGCQTNSIHERNWYFRCAGGGGVYADICSDWNQSCPPNGVSYLSPRSRSSAVLNNPAV